MDKFNAVKNDKEIIQIYNKITEVEDINKGWAHHDFSHVSNVADMVEKILSSLNYDNEFIEEAKITALLHDTGCIEGKENHSIRSYEYAKQYFKKKQLNLKNEELILEAIKIHSGGFDTDNIIALVLIVSDKLDIKQTRVAKEGYNIEGMKQIQFIKDILVGIHDNILEINFICDEKINKDELENFYFIEKVFKSINSFSKKMQLTPNVLFNFDKWEKFYLSAKIRRCN